MYLLTLLAEENVEKIMAVAFGRKSKVCLFVLFNSCTVPLRTKVSNRALSWEVERVLKKLGGSSESAQTFLWIHVRAKRPALFPDGI